MHRFLIKLLLNGVIVVPYLTVFTEATFWQALLAAIVLSAIAYVVGDQAVLRRTNNTVATLVDALLAYVYFFAVARWMNWSLSSGELFTLVLAIGVIEVFYHMYLEARDEKGAA